MHENTEIAVLADGDRLSSTAAYLLGLAIILGAIFLLGLLVVKPEQAK